MLPTTSVPISEIHSESLAIWMSALRESGCSANRNGISRQIDWRFVSGNALYTNGGGEPEWIEPFALQLESGETMIVTWLPGETAYTVERRPAAPLAA